jgi:uncharacterized Zn finger protein
VKCRNCRKRFYEVVTGKFSRGRNCDMRCPSCGDSLNERFDRIWEGKK